MVGVLGRAAGVLGGQSLLSLYNGLVLPHLLYCLMVLGDFREGRNATVGGSLLRLQKGLAGMIAGKRGIYHADPLLAKHGMLKVGPWGTSTGSSLGSTPGDSGMAGYQITRQLCWTGLRVSMGMVQGRLGRGFISRPGTTGLWATGSPRSGPHCRRCRGVWRLWGRLRGGQGWGFWLTMGLLGVGRWGVGCAGVVGSD